MTDRQLLPTDEDRRQLNVRLPESTIRTMRRLAAQENVSLGQWVAVVIDAEILRRRDVITLALREEAERAAREADLWEQDLAAREHANELKAGARDSAGASKDRNVGTAIRN